MSNVTYLPWVPQEGEPTQERAETVEFASVVTLNGVPNITEVAGVTEVDSVESVYESLLRKLGMADMSSHETLVWLRERDLTEAEAEELLAKVQHLGYVDDFRLAEQLTSKLTLRKGQGRTAIALELRKRHLSPAAIEEALSSIDQVDELDRAIEQATARAAQLQRFDKATAERRLHGYLARRGYPSDIVREAIRGAFSEYPPAG
jgi:regulatory protein